MNVQFIVTSKLRGDLGVYFDSSTAIDECRKINAQLWDNIVYTPLSKLKWEDATPKTEIALSEQYRNEEYHVRYEETV